ncbi:MAG: AraC family transcriptional regulator [Myxococcales bacterium]
MAVAGSITSFVPFLVAAAARAEGIDPARLLREAGIAFERPPSPDEHVDIERYLALWRSAVALIPDRAFPLRAAAAFKLEDNELFGFLAMSCETLGEAYDRTAAYRGIYVAGARWELQVDADAERMIWYPWPGDPRDEGYRAAMDFTVADMANAVRRLGRASPRPVAVRLSHGTPPDASPFVEQYGVEPQFGAPLYELVYACGLREMPIATFNSRLRDYFDVECSKLLADMASDVRLTTRVRKHLIGAMGGGGTSMARVAKDLGMSTRGLQRHLAAEATTYNDLVDAVREEFAKRYLTRGTLSASEVAYLIGFVEPPAFFKAFKRWTGMTPRAFQAGASA